MEGDILVITEAHQKELYKMASELYDAHFNSDLAGCVPDGNQSIVEVHDDIINLAKKYKKIIVFAFDAMSFDYFSDHILPHLSDDIQLKPLTSVFPSTTASAWPSIITGTLPAEHAIYGTSFKMIEEDKNYIWISNSLNKGDKHELAGDNVTLNRSGKPTIFEKLTSQGWNAYYNGTHGQGVTNPMRNELVKGAIHHTPEGYATLKYNPQQLINTLLNRTHDIVDPLTSGKTIVWNYCDIDDYIHEYGYKSLTDAVSWGDFIADIYRFSDEETAIVIISDHGQINQHQCPLNWRTLTKDHPWLEYDTGGAGRTLYFYPKAEYKDRFKKFITTAMGDAATILTREEAFDKGLYVIKEKDAVFPERIGDIIAIAKTPNFVSAGSGFVAEHGALSREEMLVPFAILTTDNGHIHR
ncbi:hypothetical protein EYC58_04485 [Candidatus Saccharibacteria bacterium]|nr:MAG: hypothetical protein EYC58_04485 [Candidatus Saccharibacteria bacterium]